MGQQKLSFDAMTKVIKNDHYMLAIPSCWKLKGIRWNKSSTNPPGFFIFWRFGKGSESLPIDMKKLKQEMRLQTWDIMDMSKCRLVSIDIVGQNKLPQGIIKIEKHTNNGILAWIQID